MIKKTLPTPSKKLKYNDCKFGFQFCGLEHCRKEESNETKEEV